jgi:antitoxin Phd
MPNDTMRDERGRAVETITATQAKNAFGKVLDTALTRGVVAITKREKVHAVVLSMEAYGALVHRSSTILAGLESEFDTLVATMQTPAARAAGDALFAAKPAALGRTATKAAAPARTATKAARKRA